MSRTGPGRQDYGSTGENEFYYNNDASSMPKQQSSLTKITQQNSSNYNLLRTGTGHIVLRGTLPPQPQQAGNFASRGPEALGGPNSTFGNTSLATPMATAPFGQAELNVDNIGIPFNSTNMNPSHTETRGNKKPKNPNGQNGPPNQGMPLEARLNTLQQQNYPPHLQFQIQNQNLQPQIQQQQASYLENPSHVFAPSRGFPPPTAVTSATLHPHMVDPGYMPQKPTHPNLQRTPPHNIGKQQKQNPPAHMNPSQIMQPQVIFQKPFSHIQALDSNQGLPNYYPQQYANTPTQYHSQRSPNQQEVLSHLPTQQTYQPMSQHPIATIPPEVVSPYGVIVLRPNITRAPNMNVPVPTPSSPLHKAAQLVENPKPAKKTSRKKPINNEPSPVEEVQLEAKSPVNSSANVASISSNTPTNPIPTNSSNSSPVVTSIALEILRNQLSRAAPSQNMTDIMGLIDSIKTIDAQIKECNNKELPFDAKAFTSNSIQYIRNLIEKINEQSSYVTMKKIQTIRKQITEASTALANPIHTEKATFSLFPTNKTSKAAVNNRDSADDDNDDEQNEVLSLPGNSVSEDHDTPNHVDEIENDQQMKSHNHHEEVKQDQISEVQETDDFQEQDNIHYDKDNCHLENDQELSRGHVLDSIIIEPYVGEGILETFIHSITKEEPVEPSPVSPTVELSPTETEPQRSENTEIKTPTLERETSAQQTPAVRILETFSKEDSAKLEKVCAKAKRSIHQLCGKDLETYARKVSYNRFGIEKLLYLQDEAGNAVSIVDQCIDPEYTINIKKIVMQLKEVERIEFFYLIKPHLTKLILDPLGKFVVRNLLSMRKYLSQLRHQDHYY